MPFNFKYPKQEASNFLLEDYETLLVFMTSKHQ
jgi:hypothetical protein